jgi:arylsulfatase A-like enzyme
VLRGDLKVALHRSQQSGGLETGSRKMIRIGVPRAAAAAGLLLLAVLLSCGGGDKPLNVIVVGIDTLRPDHLTCYGYERATSPNIDELAASGVLFENTISQAPWTAPAFATVFTSLYPSQHGSMGVRSKVRSSVPTLATMLKEYGYATGAIINAPALKPEFGLSRGFDFYDMTPLDGRIGDGTTRDALEWIDEHSGGPFFIFVHYFDPHIPYAPPPGYDDLFNPGYEGRIKNPFDLEGFSLARPRLFEELKVLTADDWAEVIDLYDGEIVYVDSAFGDLVRGVEERGLRDNTVIIMLSDHGEEFFEHGAFEHGHSLYDELIRVPLVVSMPGRVSEGIRVRNQVRLLDVTPTVFDLIGLPPQPHFEGVSLVPYLTGQGSVEAAADKLLPPHIAFSEAIRLGTEKKAVTARPHKFIYDIVSAQKEFYNLDADPGETHDVGDEAGSSALLQSTLFKTVLEVDESWYIEMGAGGKSHVFDIKVVSERGLASGRIYLPRLIEPGGDLVEVVQHAASSIGENTLEVTDIETDKRVFLAFKAGPDNIPLTFDLRIDGESALAHTYLGASLEKPAEMPFSQKARRQNIKARGRPRRQPPTAPYLAVWVSEATFRGDTAVTLTEETKKELRSLGYIQ